MVVDKEICNWPKYREESVECSVLNKHICSTSFSKGVGDIAEELVQRLQEPEALGDYRKHFLITTGQLHIRTYNHWDSAQNLSKSKLDQISA